MEKSEEGVRAFTLHWFDALEYAYVTTKTGPLKAITRPECDLCARKMIDPSDGLAKNGSWSEGGEIAAEVTLAALVVPNSGVSNFRMDQEELLIYSKNGDYYGKLPGTKKPDAGTLTLEYDKGWQVTDLQWLDTK